MSIEEVRARIDSLYNAIGSSNTHLLTLSDEPAVPWQFLEDNSIHLARYDFFNRHWENQQPPILFAPRQDLGKYPIEPDSFKGNTLGNTYFTAYSSSSEFHNVKTRATELAHYINMWTKGTQIPSEMPPTALGLFELHGISPV
jgi:hypothetical protein